MHPSVYDFVTRVLGREEVEGRRILEVGALDVNGSVRPYVTSLKPREYVGVDMRAGRRVDQVIVAERLISVLGCQGFDVVLCLETLEHVQPWRLAIFNMAAQLRDGGRFVLTTRSPGYPRHEHPNDFWRFDWDQLRHLFSPWQLVCQAVDPAGPGVFVARDKVGELTMRWIDTTHATRAPQ